MISLLIADDHPVVREGLKRIVVECTDIRVAAEAQNSAEVLEKIKFETIDVVLLDISMPGDGFLQTLQNIRSISPRTKVLVLSIHGEDQYGVRALKAGASGYLTKDRSTHELAEAIRCVYCGKQYMSASLGEKLFDREAAGSPKHLVLSNREFEVMGLLTSGCSISSIADKLQLSPKTVSTYRTRILEKMKFSSNAELVRYAVEHELVP